MSESKTPVQNLEKFRLPANFRGRSALTVQLWWLVQAILFGPSPQLLYGWRVGLLRLFGAKIGRNVRIRPSVRITYPWKVKIGDNAWVGDKVVLYSLGEISIGTNAVVSQNCYLCTGNHDYRQVDFPISAKAIVIEPEAWLAADCFVGPGITVGQGAVATARSSVFADLKPMTVYAGNPAQEVRPRHAD